MNPLRVVLVDPRNPLNIGAAARAMSNFGCSEMRLVNPYEVAFREARSAVKSLHVLKAAQEFASVAEAVADCALVVGTTSRGPRTLEHPLRRLELGGRIIAKKLAAAPVALLFGSEKFGLSNDDLSHCHWLMRIPTREEHGSMNLGQAVGVCLYEIVRQPAAERAAAEPRRAADAESADAESLGKRVATPQNEQDCRQADCAPDFLLASEVGEAVHQARIGVNTHLQRRAHHEQHGHGQQRPQEGARAAFILAASAHFRLRPENTAEAASRISATYSAAYSVLCQMSARGTASPCAAAAITPKS